MIRLVNDEDRKRILYQLLVQLRYDIIKLFDTVLCIMFKFSNMSTFIVLGNNNIIIDILQCNTVSRTSWAKA